MIGKRRTYPYALLVLLTGLLTLPSLAGASSGGSPLAQGGPPAATGNGPTSASTGAVRATGGGITLITSAQTMLRGQLSFSGTTPLSDAGRAIVIERSGHQTGWQWRTTVKGTIGPDGSFRVLWRPSRSGRFSIRARIGNVTAASAAVAVPTVVVTVYRSALATQYGPGFYGRRTACGTRLGRHTIGVANRTLRCGTSVAILYRGRTMIVPVIDHGPYANGADWDLTEATGRSLGIKGTARIGAVSLPPPPAHATRR